MKKQIIVAIIISINRLACAFYDLCEVKSCENSIALKLRAASGSALGPVNGTLTVDGDVYQVKQLRSADESCELGYACVGAGSTLTFSYKAPGIAKTPEISVDLSADNGTQRLRAAMSVNTMQDRVSFNDEDCRVDCVQWRGDVSFQ